MITILFLAANPASTTKLRLDEEYRAIDERIYRAEFRDTFEIKQHWATRVTDLQECLLRHKPHIVHFSGHGTQSSEIVLQDNLGNSQPVPTETLRSLFFTLKDNIRCVVLNACYSEKQALAIAEHIECVIGMSRAVSDSAAISFAFSFYQALGYGRSVRAAFDLGCIQIGMEGLREQETPKLLAPNSDPSDVFFLPQPDKSLASLQKQGETRSCIRLKQIKPVVWPSPVESHNRLVTIGRDPDGMITVPDRTVSWEQGQIILVRGTYCYRHLSNNSPTIVCRRGEEHLLRPGEHKDLPLQNQDRLIIGDTEFVVEFDLIGSEYSKYIPTEKESQVSDDE
jgi:hypothetical protein